MNKGCFFIVLTGCALDLAAAIVAETNSHVF